MTLGRLNTVRVQVVSSIQINWQDVDPDLRMFVVWGIPIIAIGFLFKWLGMWW